MFHTSLWCLLSSCYYEMITAVCRVGLSQSSYLRPSICYAGSGDISWGHLAVVFAVNLELWSVASFTGAVFCRGLRSQWAKYEIGEIRRGRWYAFCWCLGPNWTPFLETYILVFILNMFMFCIYTHIKWSTFYRRMILPWQNVCILNSNSHRLFPRVHLAIS